MVARCTGRAKKWREFNVSPCQNDGKSSLDIYANTPGNWNHFYCVEISGICKLNRSNPSVNVRHLLEEASWVLTDLCKAGNDVVEVEVRQSSMVTALPLHLEQQQIPAVHRRQNGLLLPGNTGNKTAWRMYDRTIYQGFDVIWRCPFLCWERRQT